MDAESEVPDVAEDLPDAPAGTATETRTIDGETESTPEATPSVPGNLLVFSLAGRLGSGASFVGRNLRDELFSYRYEVVTVDASLLIMLGLVDEDNGNADADGDNVLDNAESRFEKKYPKPEERTRALQDGGNQLRAKYGPDILARYAVRNVIATHIKSVAGAARRLAFIIDSLKRPEEVDYLRRLFGSSYFAVGVVSTDARREDRLRERKGYDGETFIRLSERDRKESESDSGQRAVNTVLKSDYFFANNYSTKDQIKPEVVRFLALVFNASVNTPRGDEFAMNVAYKAAARSACLSRQVGSAIVDASGQVIATGCNDVPKPGGGLYSSEDSEDNRCWARGGKCYNDEEKMLIVSELVEAFEHEIGEGELLESAKKGEFQLQKAELVPKLADLLKGVVSQSRIRQLIEFSRAVHAEMDAIMAVARSGRGGSTGSTLYCTTYPCHNCVKHIIDVGITRLVYLEPYEKSLARKLHSDAISDDESARDKVRFQLYNGVAPGRYSDFFEIHSERKSNGKYVDRSDDKSKLLPIVQESADDLWRRLSKDNSPIKKDADYE